MPSVAEAVAEGIQSMRIETESVAEMGPTFLTQKILQIRQENLRN